MYAPTTTPPLQISAVSQSQANQRAGRAGRESAGTCFRLFTEDTFALLDSSSKPEVQRVGIAQVVLQLFVIGVSNPLAFPFPSPPSTQSLQKSLKQLFRLGAISSEVRGKKLFAVKENTSGDMLCFSHFTDYFFLCGGGGGVCRKKLRLMAEIWPRFH
jgi:HrpA-like RNA helicase